MFNMDGSSKEIKNLLKSKTLIVGLKDIEEVIDPDFGKFGVFALLRLKPECREKFEGHEIVATSLASQDTPQDNASIKSMMDKLFKKRNLKELVFAKLTDEAHDYTMKFRK